jgi:hypothetical protein
MPEPGGSHGSLRTRALPATPEEAALAPSSSRPAMLRAWRIGSRLTRLAAGNGTWHVVATRGKTTRR